MLGGPLARRGRHLGRPAPARLHRCRGPGPAAAGCAALRGGGGGTPEPSSTDASWRGLGARGGRATPTRGLPGTADAACPRTASPCSRIDCIARRSVDLLMRAASCALVSSKRGAAAPGANLLTRGARPRRSRSLPSRGSTAPGAAMRGEALPEHGAGAGAREGGGGAAPRCS